jgi:FAD/FMN-containing dehydrogenase
MTDTYRVGVGGHALHGGYGVSSHTKGLALDCMVGATVVLANSTVVNTSATENPEFIWAIRGAGGSMGIVSSFRFHTFAVKHLPSLSPQLHGARKREPSTVSRPYKTLRSLRGNPD